MPEDEPIMDVTEEASEGDVVEEVEVFVEEDSPLNDKSQAKKKRSPKLLYGCLTGIAVAILFGCGGGGFFGYRYWTGYISDSDWKTLSPPQSSCRVAMPGDPVLSRDGSNPAQPVFRYTVEKPLARSAFLLRYYDLPSLKVPANEELEMLITEKTVHLSNAEQARLESGQPLHLGPYLGKEVCFRLSGGRLGIVHFFLVPLGNQTRVYELFASGPNMDSKSGPAGKFFNSFEIVAAPADQPQAGGPAAKP